MASNRNLFFKINFVTDWPCTSPWQNKIWKKGDEHLRTPSLILISAKKTYCLYSSRKKTKSGARHKNCHQKAGQTDEDTMKNELRSHSETPSGGFGSTRSIFFLGTRSAGTDSSNHLWTHGLGSSAIRLQSLWNNCRCTLSSTPTVPYTNLTLPTQA